MIKWKREKIHNEDMLARRLRGETIICIAAWTDNTVSITVGFEGIDLELTMDTWEEFNLRYNLKD